MWFACGLLAAAVGAFAFSSSRSAQGVDLDAPDGEGIHIEADYSQEWRSGKSDVAILRGNVVVRQGGTTTRAREAVLWREVRGTGTAAREFLSLYLEGDVVLDRTGTSRSGSSLYLELVTAKGITHRIARRLQATDGSDDPVFTHAATRRRLSRSARVLPTGMQAPGYVPPEEEPRVVSQPRGIRRIRIFPRSAVPYNVESFRSEDTTPPEQVWLLTGGVNLVLDGDAEYGTISLAADRIVIWTEANRDGEFRAESMQPGDTPFQVYLEGNILIRQAARVIRASRAFYDAREDRGMMLDAELRSPLPQVGGTIRIRAEQIRQDTGQRFHAHRGWASTSEFGKPGYRLQASDIFLEKRYVRPWINSTDPATGRPLVEEVDWMTTENNTILINDIPVYYNRRISAPAEDPNIPLSAISVGNNRIFGAQVDTTWNMFRLAGLEEPDNVRWDLHLDYRSVRGIGAGTGGVYRGIDDRFGEFNGEGLIYGMTDSGTDNLGGFRTDVATGEDFRGRVQLRHRQDLPSGTTIFGEFGLLSDRNVLEQYWESEFDNGKDVDTSLYARHLVDNWGLTGLAAARINDFDSTTDWLPRFDLYGLSEPFLNGRLTYSTHSYAGYGNLQPGTGPTDPLEQAFYTPLTTPLAGPASSNGLIADASGAVLMTRHQFDAPLHLGPLNVTPYVMGEAAHWGEGFDGQPVDRLVGTAGVRTSLLFWKVFPRVRSRLFNLNGLAHKMRLEAGYHVTDSSRDLSEIPQYNDMDDNSEERFREFFVQNTFGGALPGTLEPRYYGLRSGVGSSVTSPYHEIIDDQQVARLAWRHRLQTKVGPPDRLRIRDWMSLDLEGSYFPNSARDNFGEDVGLLNARYEWNFSDRTRFIANAQHDVFENAPSVRSVGLLSQRGERGSVYLGYRQFEFGSIETDYVTGSYTYKMSPKWMSTFAATYDLTQNQNVGQSLTVTRIGRDFVTHFGFQFSETKDDVGFVFMVQPKFGGLASGPLQFDSLFGGGQQQ